MNPFLFISPEFTQLCERMMLYICYSYLQVKTEEPRSWSDAWLTTLIKTHNKQKSKCLKWKNWDVSEPETCTSLLKQSRKRKEECKLSFLIFFNGKHSIIEIVPPPPVSLFSLFKITSAFPENDPLRLLNGLFLWPNVHKVANIPPTGVFFNY